MTTFVSEITAGATSHVLNTLSTLYTNPPYAVMREFIANGIDAHKDAGYDGPVEVELPTLDAPHIVIRDHGNGMDRDTLVNTYYNYGESTKRGDTTRIGAFGLGSKSAFALSPTWELVSVTDTSVIRVRSTINGDGMPEHTLDEQPNSSSMENGVTAIIPVSSAYPVRQFSTEAERLVSWLPKGSVELKRGGNFHTTSPHWTERAVAHGNLAFPKGNTLNDANVVMGGVPYRADLKEAHDRAIRTFARTDGSGLPYTSVFGEISRDVLHDVLQESRAIAVLDDPKALDVTTSRDDIKLTERSVAALENVFVHELTEALEFFTTTDGSMASLETAKNIPFVGLIMPTLRSKRLLAPMDTALIPYESRKKHPSGVRAFSIFHNILWSRYSTLPTMIVTDYPETMPALPMLDRVIAGDFRTPRNRIYVTHGPDTGRTVLDVGRDVLERHGVKFMSWNDYAAHVKEIRRVDREEAGPPVIQPVEGIILSDHKVVSTFSVEVGKLGKIIEANSGVPLYFTNMWSEDPEKVLPTLPRGFTGILIRTLMNTRRDNLLTARHGVLPNRELGKLTSDERNIAAIKALAPKQRRAVLDHLDIESRSGVDYAAVNAVYTYHLKNGTPLAGSHFVKSLESCEIGRRVVADRDAGFKRYSMNNEAILQALRKDGDRFYNRYPLLTILNVGRASGHEAALDAVVHYIKTVENAQHTRTGGVNS